ncbi:acyltransferase family protein [Derxia gummosa]|uniref:Acyltransferase family protein n=1 Tax=Derxia gummosa DSM 723 TaxID=1121388 RepID=A0A8B6X536_9BURK|nr:acyltransferase family protein [Derxia gummosa]
MRDDKIDLLRFLGLAMIVLAHVEPPALVFQLRNFDVPLMVLVSGLSFGLSYRQESFGAYAWKRVKRLLLPVWIFLTGYFLSCAALGFPTPLPDAPTVLSSYTLMSGIGYVWVIRVFLLLALLAPGLWWLARRTPSQGRWFGGLGLGLLAYQALLWWLGPWLGTPAGALFETLVLETIGYALVFAAGLRLPDVPRRAVALFAGVALAGFAATAAWLRWRYGFIVSTQQFKYPPSAYYLSYALGVSALLWLAGDALVAAVTRLKLIGLLRFAAQNSIWIYLWHIALIPVFHLPFQLRYVVVFGCAWVLAYAQVSFVKRVLMRRVESPRFRRNLALLFTG